MNTSKIIGGIISAALLLPARLGAQGPTAPTTPSEPPDLQTLKEVINQSASYIRLIGYGAGIAALIYAGILYLTAYGDTQKPQEAKRMIIGVITGLIFITLAEVLVRGLTGELDASRNITP